MFILVELVAEARAQRLRGIRAFCQVAREAVEQSIGQDLFLRAEVERLDPLDKTYASTGSDRTAPRKEVEVRSREVHQD